MSFSLDDAYLTRKTSSVCNTFFAGNLILQNAISSELPDSNACFPVRYLAKMKSLFRTTTCDIAKPLSLDR